MYRRKDKIVAIRFSELELALIDKIATQSNTKRSKVIRKAIRNGLAECEDRDWNYFYD